MLRNLKSERYSRPGKLALAEAAWGHEFELIDLEAPPPFEVVNGAAVVCIDGPLTHHSHPMWDSYDDIAQRMKAAFDCPESRCVVMKINSPGGDVAGCFETAREIRNMAAAANKPLIAYADGMAASAAYALASSASQIVVSLTGLVGSIGIIEAMVDQTGADAAMGLRYAMITSGERKADGNPHVPITEDAVSHLQAQVLDMAELFYSLVSDHRGKSAGHWRGLRAAMFFGEQAVGKGLADKVSTFGELLRAATALPGAKAMPDFTEEKKEAKAEGGGEEPEDPKSKAKKMIAGMMADGSDDDRKMYSKMLKMLDGPGEEEEAPKSEKKEAMAKAEDEKEKAKAAAADPTLAAVSALAEVQKLRAEIAAEKDTQARAAIFASRPDLPKAVVTLLGSKPVAEVKALVDAFPKGPTPAAAAAVTGTRGMGADGVAQGGTVLNDANAEFIAKAMGRAPKATGIEVRGKDVIFGAMTQEQAAKRLAEIEAGRKGAQ